MAGTCRSSAVCFARWPGELWSWCREEQRAPLRRWAVFCTADRLGSRSSRRGRWTRGVPAAGSDPASKPSLKGRSTGCGAPVGGFGLARKMVPDGPAGIRGRGCRESAGRAVESGKWWFCGAEVRHGLPARPIQNVLLGASTAPLL